MRRFTERDDPAASAVRPSEFIRTYHLSQTSTHRLWLRFDDRADKVALDPNEDWPEVEARERLLIGGRNVGFSGRPCTGDDSTDQPTEGGCLLHLPYRSSIQQRPGAPDVVLKPSREWLMGDAVERAGQFGVTERLDQVGDVQAQKVLQSLTKMQFVRGRHPSKPS
jgi:hypothetical protein